MATKVAVTGHMELSEETVPLVRAELERLLRMFEPSGLVGLSCVAPGADSLFAESVLAAGGRLVAVLPSRDYRTATVKPDHAETYDRLTAAADEVLVLPFETASREAYEAANAVLLERADRLVAIWDGQPNALEKAGTMADIVSGARGAGLAVDVVWPAGASRQTATAAG
ncbi:hypothetical protein GCM10012287_15980 [Streptomyces daqingensis]|uniref:Uncharacterized protein n=1 Tax=Streptomyces daqingensis TaxID=1472640 RepID=A0ABQ2M2W0_9ACTN|nr:hypothetical protein [Streptomyces daqingensis]GGO46209.1 hypothetical protein GCM10012287_15980 [Streptomyces daqingensis]